VPRGFERFPFTENRKNRWRSLRDWIAFAEGDLRALNSELRPSQILTLLVALRSSSPWFRAFLIGRWIYRVRKARRRAARAGRR
jgi:hypothetical protein